MKHKAHILLVGISNDNNISNIPEVLITKCNSEEELIPLIINNKFDLIISYFLIGNKNAIEVNKNIESVKEYYSNKFQIKSKYLILTSSKEEEESCKKNHLLYYPSSMNLRSLLIQLIDLPKKQNKTNKQPAIIDFKELFIRVDNNRDFIKTVIEKFFEVKETRILEIKTPLEESDFKKAKDAAHKLKGVLANFSMTEARLTIIELEKLILEHNKESAINKLEELIQQLEKVIEFYNQNQDKFR